MKKLVLLLLFSVIAYAQPQTGAPYDLIICDENSDGVATFDLTSNDMVVLGGLNPSEYSVSYYETLADATNGANPIAFPQSYSNIMAATINGSQTLYVRVEENNVPTNYDVQAFSVVVNPTPIIITPTPLIVCDEALQNDGYATFDLNSKNDEILAGLNPGAVVTYYSSQAAMEAGLALPFVYTNSTPGEQTLYVKVTSIYGCTAATTLTLKVYPLPEVPELPALNGTCGLYDLTNNENLYSSYEAEYFETAANAEANNVSIAAPAQYNSPVTTPSVVYVRITNPATGCYTIKEQPLAGMTEIMSPVITVTDSSIVITQPVGSTYVYSIDGGITFQLSNIFVNLVPGAYTATVKDVCGNISMVSVIISISAPYGPDVQPYVAGQTLADLNVEGENIQWYADAVTIQPLPADTVVSPNTTYYATQTVNGYESARYAFTIMSVSSVTQQTSIAVAAYPNPAGSSITLTGKATLTQAEVYNILGQLAFSQSLSGNTEAVDLQTLQPGIYLLKVYSGNASKTIRIIKE